MPDLTELQTQLDGLRAVRAKGVNRLRMGAEEVTYRTDAELLAAICDLERRIAGAQGTAIRTVRFASSKGL